MDGAQGVEAPAREPRMAPVEPGSLAGFWIRVLADCLDAVFLFLVGWVASFPLRSVFERLGENGVFVGLSVSLLYVGVLQSRFGGGQTLAKRLLGLRVLRTDGKLMSLDRSLVRYAMVGFLIYQGGVSQAVATVLGIQHPEPIFAVQTAAALVLFLGCVIVVPFHPLKRGLHDLVAGTIVVRNRMPDPVFIEARTNPRRDRRIVLAALCLFAILCVLAVTLTPVPAQRSEREARLLHALKVAGVSNPHLSDRIGGRREIGVGGYISPAQARNGGEEATHAQVVSALKTFVASGPDDPPEIVVTALRTGINIAIYRAYRRPCGSTAGPRASV